MSKRVAGKQMTQDNWAEEDEQEEAGVFKLASDDVMKDRKVIKPRRKLEGGESTGSGGAFKGFGGFTSMKPAAGGPSGLFSFGTGTKSLSGLSNGSEAKSSEIPSLSVKPTAQKDNSDTSSADAKENTKEKTKPVTNGVGKSEGKSKYLQQLKCLNESVSKWIKEHVDKNAYCILTPIFKDYEKHLAEIEKINPDNTKSAETGSSEKESEKKTESEKMEEKPDESIAKSGMEQSTKATSLFSFGSSVTSTTSSSAPSGAGTSLFSFSSSKSTTSTTVGSVFGGAAGGGASGASTGFSFGSTSVKPFSFATGSASSGSAGNDSNQPAAAEEEEYVPPKAEISEIKEDDALYSKRCKMYYQKDGTWVEKGVGNLHLKPCSGKTQLLIRADTNLGNILLNIMLSSQIPFARQGKNNVSFMCIPNPPIDPKEKGDPKPTSILLRVKTASDADELLEKINEHKDS